MRRAAGGDGAGVLTGSSGPSGGCPWRAARGARGAPAESRRPAGGRGRTSQGRRRVRTARGREPSSDADAAPRVLWKVELAAPRGVALRHCPSRWPLAAQEPEQAEGNGPPGWVGRWEGRGRGGGGGRRTGREGGVRGGRPEPAAPGWELGPGRSPGRGRGGRGGAAGGSGIGGLARGGVWGPAGGAGAAGVGASPIPSLSPRALLGSGHAGIRGVSGRPLHGVLRPSAGASRTAGALESEGAGAPPWGTPQAIQRVFEPPTVRSR